MTIWELADLIEEYVAEGDFLIHYSDLELVEPADGKFDHTGKCIKPPSRSGLYMNKITRLLIDRGYCAVTVNERMFDGTYESNPPTDIEDAKRFVPDTKNPMRGIYVANGPSSTDWVIQYGLRRRGRKHGRAVSSVVDNVAGAVGRREFSSRRGAELIEDAYHAALPSAEGAKVNGMLPDSIKALPPAPKAKNIGKRKKGKK